MRTCAGCGRECAERPPRASDIRRGRRRACSQTRTRDDSGGAAEIFARASAPPPRCLRFAIGGVEKRASRLRDGSPETGRVFLADTRSFFFGFELRRFPAFDARARVGVALSSWRSVRGVIHVRRNPSRWCVAFASLPPHPRARSPRPDARRFRRTSRARGSSSLGFTRSRNAIPTPEPARRDDDERPRDASSTASRSPITAPWTSWRSRGVGARSRRVARVARVASGKTPTR